MDLKEKYGKILRENGLTDEIARIVVSKPDLAGQHLASVIETVRIDFENPETPPLDLFVKKRLSDGENPAVDNYMKFIMLKEGAFLKNFTQQLHEFSLERTNGSWSPTSELFPEVYYYDEDIIVMENLLAQGYAILPKIDSQDFKDASTAVRHLAKLHAVSFVMIENAGGSKQFLKNHANFEEQFTQSGSRQSMSKAFEPRCILSLEVLKNSTHEDKDEKYALIKKYEGNVIDTMCEAIEAETLFYAVLHGDCWNNNMMFNEAKDKVVLVDFQFYMVGSPSLDLSFFMFSSVKGEVRERWRDLLWVYFESLKANVEVLEHPFEFEFEDFVQDFIRKSKLGFLFGLFSVIGMEALGNHDTENSSEDFLTTFTNLMSKWVEDNPDKVQAASESMISLIDDYLLVGEL